jgi:hypothetical protein
VRRLMPAIALLLPLCSCQSGAPRGSVGSAIGRGIGGFGAALHEMLVARSAVFSTGLRLCERTQAELLATAGESFRFDADFTCGLESNSSQCGFCILGIGDGDSQATRIPAVTDAELWTLCDDTKRALRDLSPSEAETEHIYLYLCRQEEARANPLVRLGFAAGIQEQGTVSIVCDTATLVGWNDVRWVEPPPTRS